MRMLAGRNNEGQSRLHRAKRVWKSALAILLLSGPLAFGTAFAEGRVIFELVEGRDFQGRVRHATFDGQGRAWLATYRELFKVEHGRAVAVIPGVPDGPAIAFAPGGERFALMNNRKAAYGRFAAALFDANRPTSPLAVLQPVEPPYGLGALRLGREGKLIMGITALGDPEGLKGDFRYSFWSSEGRELETAVLDEHRIGVLNEQGESVLLLGDSEVAAYRNDGTLLWTTAGQFRSGTLSQSGEVALLNPADAIDEVHLVRSGHVDQVLALTDSVYGVAITPDGSLAAVANGAGRIHVIELRSCPGKDCRPRRLPPLPVLSTHYVTSLRFVSEHLLALGVIQAAGAGPYRRFYGGMVLIIGMTGELQFQNSIELPEPATWSPSLDVTFGSPMFAAYTPTSAMFVRLED